MTEFKPELNIDAEHHRKLADGFLVQGKLAEAVTACQAAIALQSDFTVAYITLGKAQLGQGRLDDAAAAYAQAITLQPDCGEAYADLGTIALQSGQINEAISLYRRATELQPDLPISHWMLANLLNSQGNTEESFAHQQRALELKPDLIGASEHDDMGRKLLRQGKLEEAISCFQRAISLKPDDAEAFFCLGQVFSQQKRVLEAITCYQKTVEIDPNRAEAHFQLGNSLVGIHRVVDAVVSYEKALEIKPDFSVAYWNLITSLGRMRDKNLQKLRGVVERFNQFCGTTDGIKATIAYISVYLQSGCNGELLVSRLLDLEYQIEQSPDRLAPEDIKALYIDFLFSAIHMRADLESNTSLAKQVGGLYVQKVIGSQQNSFSIDGKSKRTTTLDGDLENQKLRIGFLSPHFKRHSVGWNSSDLIRELSSITPYIYLYVTGEMNADDRTQLFERSAEKLYWGENLTDPPALAREITAQIHQDNLDILVDLDSLTVPVNLEILHQKPASVCISWLGGFEAPFISTDNYFLGDRYTLPEATEAYYRERIVRMPNAYIAVSGFTCDSIGRDFLRHALGLAADCVAYLCLAPGRKFNPDIVRAQVSILKHVPNGILLHRGGGDKGIMRSAYHAECDKQGIDFQRIQFLELQSPEEKHRTIYTAADVLLDSYPYNGGTHTLEGLWFNLPLVTRTSDRSLAISRMGYSFLKTLKIEAGITWSWEEYTEWGIRFGLDADLRNSVREQLVQSKQPESLSPLWNPKLFARDMYAILEDLRSRQV